MVAVDEEEEDMSGGLCTLERLVREVALLRIEDLSEFEAIVDANELLFDGGGGPLAGRGGGGGGGERLGCNFGDT